MCHALTLSTEVGTGVHLHALCVRFCFVMFLCCVFNVLILSSLVLTSYILIARTQGEKFNLKIQFTDAKS